MRSKWRLGLAALMLPLGVSGCVAEADPVAAQAREYTVDPAAAQGAEAVAKAELERDRKQAEVDKKASRR